MFDPKTTTVHERDTELGRWRDPEVRTRVVTEIDHRRVHVYDEETRCYSEFDDAGPGSVHLLTRGDFGLNDTALRYFSAHPEPKPWMDVPDGIYAVSPQVHPYARLLQKRAGRWLHLYRSSTEGDREPHSAEAIAKSASKDGRLTRLVPEVVSDDS